MARAAPSEKPFAALDIHDLSCSRLFDEVPCYISIQAPDLRVVEANRKLIEDFGEPVARQCYAAYKGRDEPCPECPVQRTFEDGREHSSQEVIFDRRGLPHQVVVNTKPLRNRQGEIVAVMELFTDITTQKELEYRLHDSLSRFHNLFDTVPCYISVQDSDFIIVEANQRFKEAFTERLGVRCWEVYKGRAERCPDCPVARTFEDGKVHHSEEVVTDRHGKPLHVVTYTAPIRNAAGRINSVMEVSADITEMKELQDKLAFLGQLVAGTAHSVKNILEGLHGGVYIVNMGFRGDRQDDVKTGWEMVERNVGRVSEMVMDMLYCAKDRELERREAPLEPLIREVADLYASRARDVGARIEVSVTPVGLTVFADPKRLHALVANLAGNALDACSADQDETKDYRVSIGARDAGDETVIEVEDNGIGMDEETCQKLFRMFFSTKGSYGTGLGLLVSQKVAAEHGGSISVESSPGKGTVFTVRLPVVPQARSEEGAPDVEGLRPSGGCAY